MGENLLPKINEYKGLVNDYTNEFQTVLNSLSVKNELGYNAEQLQSVINENRNLRMLELWKEIEILMREEIDYYKK